MKASIKRKLVLGAKITMISSYTEQTIAGELITTQGNNKRIGIERAIETVQTNAVKFEDGSWLYFPKASDSEETEQGFIIRDTNKGVSYCLQYEFTR